MKILRKILGVALIVGPGITAIAIAAEQTGGSFVAVMFVLAIVLAIGLLAIIGIALFEDDKEGT